MRHNASTWLSVAPVTDPPSRLTVDSRHWTEGKSLRERETTSNQNLCLQILFITSSQPSVFHTPKICTAQRIISLRLCCHWGVNYVVIYGLCLQPCGSHPFKSLSWPLCLSLCSLSVCCICFHDFPDCYSFHTMQMDLHTQYVAICVCQHIKHLHTYACVCAPTHVTYENLLLAIFIPWTCILTATAQPKTTTG